MSSESDLLDKLAQSIADGASIDWEEIDNLPADAELRRLVKLLRLVSNVAEVHRSAAQDVSPPPDQISTKPITDPLPAGPRLSEPGGGLGQWGHLHLLRKIGEGAFGQVYHAHDTWLDHPVALKLFKARVAGRDPSNRILHEARKLARIRHPNVVSVHGADSHNGQIGFWMDFIDGATLADLVVTGRLSAGEATYIGQEVCRALAAVHQAEIVHRDVKAQNVMRASDGGRIILMDFGAGEFINDKSMTSRRQGTPLYLAPELFSGADGTVQSDIYAMGVLLYYLVTGAFPVPGSSVPDLVDAHRRGARRHLRDRRPDLPASFVTIVERAIDPDPARRFRSAGEMEAALTGGTTKGVGPIDIDRFRPASVERTTRGQVEFAGVVIATTVVTIELLGLIASRAFEVSMGVHQDFAAGPGEYFTIGMAAMFPHAVMWSAGAAVVALTGLRVLRSPFQKIGKWWASATGLVDGETVATIVLLCGAAGWLALTWGCWSVFGALETLRSGPTTGPVDLSALSSGAHSLHRVHADTSGYLSFLLALVAWKWFPRFEKQAADPARVRFLRWATVVLAFVVIAMAVVPRRFIWERFEVVTFDNQRAFVIGTNTEELLLYSPGVDERRRWRVPRNAATLQRPGQMARIFDSQ